MTRIILSILVAMVLPLTACGGSAAEEAEDNSEADERGGMGEGGEQREADEDLQEGEIDDAAGEGASEIREAVDEPGPE
jgi:hypothetical protein